MRQVLSTAILLLLVCDSMFAQKDDSLCPTIKIVAPLRLTMFGESIIFSVSASEKLKKYNAEYEWIISEGAITE